MIRNRDNNEAGFFGFPPYPASNGTYLKFK